MNHLNHINHINHIIDEINWSRRIESAEDGTDVYGMTGWRCLPQFFFYCRLPNQWHHNEGGGWATIEGVNVGGPLLALGVLGFMLGAGAYFMKQEEKRLIKSKLSEEVLLAYFVMEPIRKMDALIEQQKNADADEKKRIEAIATFAATYKNDILAILNQEYARDAAETDTSGKSALRRTWERTYEVFCHYSYLHWFLWMLSTVVLYQVVKDYGINEADPKHSDCPSWYTDKVLSFSQYDAALLFQTVVPFLLALLIVYKGYKREQARPHFDESSVQEQQSRIRGFYLEKKAGQSGNQVEQTHTHFTAAMTLTSITTFISSFIISNVAVWPIQGFVMKVCDIETPDTTYIPVIFAVTAFIACVQTSLKLKDMQAENKAHLGEEGRIAIQVEKPAPGLTGAVSRVWRFYGSKEHNHKAWYIIPGRVMGSGGFLLTRILFNGGMGNCRPGHIHDTNRMDMLEIGLWMTAAVIILNLAQYYAASQRQDVFKAAGDAKLRSSRQINA